MKPSASAAVARGVFWASAGFYALVAFEFFYMVSPFAAYLYGIYGPGLGALQLTGSTSWLVGFFLPHIARETGSPFLDWHEAIGTVFLIAGLAAFAGGAAQVYWSKLTRKRAIVGGMYRWVRHPQYLGLMTASFGMLLIWPRYLVIVAFVTVCFAYYLLSRLEERICTREFPDYAGYAAHTGMLLPLARMPWPATFGRSVVTGLTLYIVLLAAGFAAARALHDHAVGNLHVYETPNEAYLSVGRLPPDTIAAFARVATADPEVQAALGAHSDPGARFINYVMPTDLLISEVPMHLPPGHRTGHQSPSRQEQSRYKIVFTRAHFGRAEPADGREILRRAVNKSPIIEVWIDRRAGRVERVLEPPTQEFYAGMPVPVF